VSFRVGRYISSLPLKLLGILIRTIFYIMKTSHNLNNDMHAHDSLIILCEAYPLVRYYEAYPLFHYYEAYHLFRYYVHALCFTIQTL